jgi:hypothetical protein
MFESLLSVMPVIPAHGALIFHTRGSIVEEMLLCNSRMPNRGSITLMVIVVKMPAPSIRVG